MSGRDLLVVGKLCGNAKILGYKLLKNGFNLTILDTGKGYASDLLDEMEEAIKPYVLSINKLGYLKTLKVITAHKCIISCGGSFGRLFYKYYFYFKLLRRIPIIEMTTGSDIKELSVQKGWLPRFYRHYLKNVDVVFLEPSSIALRNAVKIGLKSAVVYRLFPYIDTGYKHPLVNGDADFSNGVRILHPSHLDWMQTDFFVGRVSIKGSDKFLAAVKRLVKSGFSNFKITLLKRGSDKEIALNYIKNNGLESYFIIKDHLSREELFEEMRKHHLLVNAFAEGALGGIAVEALSMGMPVMSYVSKVAEALYYSYDHPVISCFSVDEIYEKLADILRNPYQLIEISRRSYRYYDKYFRDNINLLPLIFYYSLLTGDDRIPKDRFEEEVEKRTKHRVNFLE